MKKTFLTLVLGLLCSAPLMAQEAAPANSTAVADALAAPGVSYLSETIPAADASFYVYLCSASWCGPCRGFTPILVKFYKQTAKKSGIELIFVSSDKTSADMMGYMEKYSMPWLGLPFDALQKTALKKELGVAGIPRLVVFGKDGKLLSRDARWDVTILGTKAVEAWQKEDYKPLTYQDAKKLKDSSKNNVKTKNKKKTKRTKTW